MLSIYSKFKSIFLILLVFFGCLSVSFAADGGTAPGGVEGIPADTEGTILASRLDMQGLGLGSASGTGTSTLNDLHNAFAFAKTAGSPPNKVEFKTSDGTTYSYYYDKESGDYNVRKNVKLDLPTIGPVGGDELGVHKVENNGYSYNPSSNSLDLDQLANYGYESSYDNEDVSSDSNSGIQLVSLDSDGGTPPNSITNIPESTQGTISTDRLTMQGLGMGSGSTGGATLGELHDALLFGKNDGSPAKEVTFTTNDGIEYTYLYNPTTKEYDVYEGVWYVTPGGNQYGGSYAGKLKYDTSEQKFITDISFNTDSSGQECYGSSCNGGGSFTEDEKPKLKAILENENLDPALKQQILMEAATIGDYAPVADDGSPLEFSTADIDFDDKGNMYMTTNDGKSIIVSADGKTTYFGESGTKEHRSAFTQTAFTEEEFEKYLQDTEAEAVSLGLSPELETKYLGLLQSQLTGLEVQLTAAEKKQIGMAKYAQAVSSGANKEFNEVTEILDGAREGIPLSYNGKTYIKEGGIIYEVKEGGEKREVKQITQSQAFQLVSSQIPSSQIQQKPKLQSEIEKLQPGQIYSDGETIYTNVDGQILTYPKGKPNEAKVYDTQTGSTVTKLNYEQTIALSQSYKGLNRDLSQDEINMLSDSEKVAYKLSRSNPKLTNEEISLINDPKLLAAFAEKGDSNSINKLSGDINSGKISLEDAQNLFKTNPSVIDEVLDGLMHDNFYTNPDNFGKYSVEENEALNKKINDLCKKAENACGDALLEMSLKGNAEDDVVTQFAQNKLTKDIAAGKYEEMSEEKFLNYVYNADQSKDEVRDMLAARNGVDCEGFFGSMWCSLSDKKDVEMQIEYAATQNAAALKAQYSSFPEGTKEFEGKVEANWIDDDVILKFDCDASIKGECERESTTACKDLYPKSKADQETCGNYARTLYDSQKKLDTEKYNTELMKSFADKNPVECDSSSTCKDAVEAYCDKDGADAKKCSEMRIELEATDDKLVVEVGYGYGILNAIRNPDANAMKVAKELFGFEADYSSLPSFLGQDAATNICLSKIEGYLDKELESNGGTTKYGCTKNYDEDNTEINNCLQVLGDIRGQRTVITPLNKTTISYSLYLRAPEEQAINYIVVISYMSGGNLIKEEVIEKTEVKEGGQEKIFDYVDLPIENVNQVDRNSFKVHLGAFIGGTTYVNINAPIVLVTAGDVLEGVKSGGNSAGNALAAEQESEEETQPQLADQDLVDMMNIG